MIFDNIKDNRPGLPVKFCANFILILSMVLSARGASGALSIESVYPTLGELGAGLEVAIHGSDFNGTSRLAMFLDSGNSMNIVGSGATPGRAWGLDVVGDKAYIADYDRGLQVFHITDPTNPMPIGQADVLPPGGLALDVQVIDQVAYVAGNSAGLQIIDVNPSNISTYLTVIGAYDTSDLSREVAVVDGIAYLADGENGLQLIDVGDPEAPSFIAAIDTPGFAYGVDVVDLQAYVADGDGGLQIIDLDPSNPGTYRTVIRSVTALSYPQGVQVVGNLAFVADYDAGLQVVDVDADSPAYGDIIGNVDTGLANDVTVVNNTAYIADSSLGLKVIDVSNPHDPFLLGSTDTPSAAYDVRVEGTTAYVADDFGGLQVIDVSRPELPTVMGGTDTPGLATAVQVAGNKAYVADWSGGLRIINVSDPANPVFNSSVSTPGDAAGVYVSEADLIAYVADWENGLQAIDVNPLHFKGGYLSTIGAVDTPGRARAITVAGNTAYLADGGSGLQLINITTPENPVIIGAGVDTPGSANDVFVADNIAYVADGYSGLQLIDVNPANTGTYMTIIGDCDTPGSAYSVAVDNRIAYVADGQEGLRIIDVNPLNTGTYLTVIGSLDTAYMANDILVSGATAYLTDGSAGVQMIDIADPANPVLIGSVDTPGWASATTVVGNVAYVADGPVGLTTVPVPVEIIPDPISATEMTATLLPDPPVAGNYTIRVFNASGSAQLAGAVTFTETINLLSSRAIVVAGGGPDAGIWEETRAYANQAYDNLIYQGYRHGDIYYLTDEILEDPDFLITRYGSQASYANVMPATRANLEDAIINWAEDSTGLLLFMEDHGEAEKFLLRGGTSPQYVTADELDTWLDTLQNAPAFTGKVTLVYDACNSGGFISRLTPPAGKIRLILTSSTPDQVAYFLDTSHSFSSHFWSTFSGKTGNKAILSDALDRGAAEMATYQTAQLDADGDGVPNQQADYDQLQGHEGTIYALRRQYNSKDRSGPVIATVAGNKTLSGSTSAQLMARSVYDMDGDGIARVWTEIVSPDFNPDDSGLTVVSLPGIQLTGPDGDGIYQSTYPGFDVRGTYIITYYAEDGSGIYSRPKVSLVRQTGGTVVVVPDRYDKVDDDNPSPDNTAADARVIVINDPSPQNHSFHTANDEDWVKFYGIQGVVYNIKASYPTIISDPVIRVYAADGTTLKGSSNSKGAGEEESLTWICPGDGLYYVRLTNNSGHYGANVRYKLKIYNPIAFSLPGYVKGRITSGGIGVAGAVIRAGSGTAITLADGSFILSLPPGSYSVSVSCAGYQSTSFAVSVASGQSVSLAKDINSVPRILNFPPGMVKANEMYDYVPVVSDIDGDPLTFSITGKPSWASFSTANGRLWGRPGAADEGIHGPITLKVTDNAGASDSLVFSVTVTKGTAGFLPGALLLLRENR